MSTTTTRRFKANGTYERVDLNPLEKFQFTGKILAISDKSVRVSKGNSKCTFWLENRLNPQTTINAGDTCTFTIAIRTYTGKDLSIKTKLYLVDVLPIPAEQIMDEPVFTMTCDCISNLKVGDYQEGRQFIMELVRLDEAGIEQETYKMRYYTETPGERFTTGRCTVEFTINNTAKTILENGDEYYDKKVNKVIENGVETVSYSNVYTPCLSITRIWPEAGQEQ